MLPHIRIPSHITALYVFAVVNLMALFHITLVEANIVVLNKFNMTVVELTDLPAKFGPPFPDNGLWGHVAVANPKNACGVVEAPPTGNHSDIKWIAIIRRHGCDFDEKVLNAQIAGYAGALVHNVGSDELIPMGSGKKGEDVDIPSAFIGETDGAYLSENFDRKQQFFIVIDNQAPFNANLYLLPFAIVVGICFILMLAFMVAKWIRDIRKRRRARLSLQHLKKLPTKKFKKGDTYDVCAICLDEYEEGEKLRILPCSHAYHMKCVDPWLTKNKRTCPVCKRKVIPGDEDDSDSDSDTDDEGDVVGESTPLLTATSGNHVHRPAREPSESHPDPAPDSSDSEVDSLSGMGAAAPPSYNSHQSLADVHTPRVGSYGAVATVTMAREKEETGSIGSKSIGSNPEDLVGAVGGEENDPSEFVDDYFTSVSEQEMTGLVSGDATEEEAQPVKSSLRVKIFGHRGKKNKKRRRDEEA